MSKSHMFKPHERKTELTFHVRHSLNEYFNYRKTTNDSDNVAVYYEGIVLTPQEIIGMGNVAIHGEIRDNTTWEVVGYTSLGTHEYKGSIQISGFALFVVLPERRFYASKRHGRVMDEIRFDKEIELKDFIQSRMSARRDYMEYR